jgi:hypothetical protein
MFAFTLTLPISVQGFNTVKLGLFNEFRSACSVAINKRFRQVVEVLLYFSDFSYAPILA